MLVDPRLGEIDQGTIFTCGYAEDYEGCNVCGLVITARCDIAQNKVPVFNYLPVVAFDDWLQRDARIILASRIERHHMGAMRNMLKNAGYADSILTVQSPRSVLDTLLPKYEEGKKSSSPSAKFATSVGHYELAIQCSKGQPDDGKLLSLASTNQNARDTLTRDLLRQNLTGYYFLPKIDSNGDDLAAR